MATAKTAAISERPLIQIDDEIREMNDEELSAYEAMQAAYVPLPTGE